VHEPLSIHPGGFGHGDTVGFRVAAALLAALAMVTGVRAGHRYVRRFDETSGLSVATVVSLSQDRAGFLWLATHGGLVRFDGHNFEPWAHDRVPGTVAHVVARPGGGALLISDRGVLLQTTASGVEPYPGPRGAGPRGVTDAAYDGAGRLWIIFGGEVWVRSGSWERLSDAVLGPHRPMSLHRLGRSMALLTSADVRLIDGPDRLARRIPIPGAADLVRRPGGGLVLLQLDGEVLSAPPSSASFHTVLRLPGKGVALAVRGEAVWAAFDRFLARIGPRDTADVMGLAEGIPSGGRLLVDHEGSLWMGTFSGLLQFPEPDTTIWTDLEGLPSAHARYVAPAPGGVLVSTWQGLGKVRNEGKGWSAGTEPFSVTGPLCTDRSGAVWFGSNSGLYRDRAGRKRKILSGPAALRGCAAGPTGLWLAGDAGLHVVRKGRAVAVPRGGNEDEPGAVDCVLETKRSELVWVRGTRICRQPVRAVLAGGSEDRVCWEQPEAESAFDLAEVGDEVWLAGRSFGLLRLGPHGGVPHPGLATLPSRVVFSIAPSPRGGVWIAGKGFVRRVLPCAECTNGWRAVETVGPWQGLPGRSGAQVLELAGGDLWIPTDNGLVRVPAAARAQPQAPPAVVLTEVLRNGEAWQGRPPLLLDWDARHLELRFSALSFRDPARIRYRSRLGHGQWSPPTTGSSLSLAGLAPGRYSLEVQASVDGTRWSGRTAGLTFRVKPPWYRSWWALLLAASAMVSALALLRWMQLTSLARVERERERIAADLHDQVGSGLASIGILASLSAGGSLTAERRRRLMADIGDVSARLSFTLRAIVWSLRDPEAELRDTIAQLADHGAKLLIGAQEGLEVVMPERWPPGPLPLLVRRNLLLIGLEALHNAARHAHASRVRLMVAPSGDGGWRMSIADDGVGFRPADHGEGGAGLGLRNMRRRAEAIGGALDVESSPGAGATVTLLFRPGWGRAREGSLGRWWPHMNM